MGVLSKAATFVVLLLIAFSYAEDFVAINSNDGRDVLSGVFYASVKGYPVRFMPTGGSADTFAAKVGGGHSILLIQSSTLPVSGMVEPTLRSAGNDVQAYPSADGGATNLDLAAKSGAQSFIIVDSAYSDGAISVMPYAALTKSYVIFADSANIGTVAGIVAGKKVIEYGYLDSKVKDALASGNPQAIGNGIDKYADNVQIVGMTMDQFHLTRPIMTDGTILEDSMTTGNSPILLTGTLVPQVTYNFVKSEVAQGKMTGVLLVGDSLVYPAYDMRQRIRNDLAAQGINSSFGVMVKFAQAIPSQGNAVMALDMFSMPAYQPQLNITEISYNTASKKLMVGLRNTGDGPLYYTIDARVQVNGADYRVFGSNATKLIERGDSDGVEYDLDLSAIPEGAITSSAVVRYGSYQNSLEQFAAYQGNLATISYTDNSNVSVMFAKYEPDNQQLVVSIRNNGDAEAYVFAKVTLVDASGVTTSFSSSSIKNIDPSSVAVEEFPLIMSDKEVQLNSQVPVTLNYGGRVGFLTKTAMYVVPLSQGQQASSLQPILLGALVAIVVLLVLYGIYKLIAILRKK